jgi:colicin import membrane protein
MVTRAEAEGEKERRVAAEQAAERASAERGAAREALAEARARLEELERQEGSLAARVREERQAREDLQVRLAAIARATNPTPARAEALQVMERRLAGLRADLADPNASGDAQQRAVTTDAASLSDAERRLAEIRAGLLEPV